MLIGKPGWRDRLLGAAFTLLLSGCAAVGLSTPTIPTEPTSIQTIEYYPYLVKGYQNSFPHRSLIVLLPTENRQTSGANANPLNGDPSIGIVTDQAEAIVQRLYSQPFPAIVQSAIARSAEEAGLQASGGKGSEYSGAEKQNADYVMATKITKCWVKKHRGPDGRFGATWSTAADFAVEVTIYKPPFKVPFWQGTSSEPYYDPSPIGSFGLGPEDEAGIYDEPGQVLSVAVTRVVAGIFQREDLRTLVEQDHMNAAR